MTSPVTRRRISKQQLAPPARVHGGAQDSALLYVVCLALPAAAVGTVEDYSAVHNLCLATWQQPEHDRCELRIYCETRTAAGRLARQLRHDLPEWLETAGIATTVEVDITELLREDWSETWKRFFHVFRVSPRLVVKPAWEPYRANRGEIVLNIDPGMSFGTGYHGTTRACLEFVDRLSARVPASSFFDVGTGSGILAMAAWKCGFRPVQACDNDPQAVTIAEENLAKAGCTGVAVFHADLATAAPVRRARVVVANILAPVLIQFAARLVSFTVADGAPSYVILSGILDAQFPAVHEAFAAHGCRLEASRTLDGWTSGIMVVPG